MNKISCWLVLIFFFSISAEAQRTVSYSGNLMNSHPTKKGVMVLQGNVSIEMEGTVVRCDWSEFNQQTKDYEATGHLRIRTKDGTIITGDYLVYKGDTKILTIDRNVVLVDDGGTVLKTDRLYQDQKTNLAMYNTGGTITDKETVLTSLRGYFESKSKTFYCAQDVLITNPDYTINTDTLTQRNNVVNFYTPTHIHQEKNYMYCEKGWYDSRNEKAFFYKNAFVATPEQTMYGDTIFYNIKHKRGNAYSNVVVVDTINDMVIKSDYGENDEYKGFAMFTKKATGIIISENDSLFLHGDTLRITYDTANHVENIFAYFKVKFFRTDMQGKCDSLVYQMKDSVMTMHRNPILWNAENQITSDTISMFIANNKPKKMFMTNNAFIVSSNKKDSTWFNQIKGIDMIGYFNDSTQMERIDVIGNTETIYYVMDEGSNELIGINKVAGKSMRIDVENNAIGGINIFEPYNAALYPLEEISPRNRILKGFMWLDKYRPKKMEDIYIRN